jgi:WbqC-like protein family
MNCCIVQPTFMPWLGFFALIDQCESAVLLDSVQFSKQSWQQRNRIRTDKGLEFLTVPVKTAGRFGQKIIEVEITSNDFIFSMESKIKLHYRKAPFFQDYFPPIMEVLKTKVTEKNLANLNIGIIRLFVEILGIKTPLVLSSALKIEAERSILLADILDHLSFSSYLSPRGASEYLWNDREVFTKRRKTVFLQDFVHPKYRQVYEPFLPFASLCDLIFNEGPNSLNIIRSGCNVPQRFIG